MITLIYASSATRPMTDDELVDLLSKARQKNHSLDVTGMLLYKNGNFLQVLEGSETTVDSLFQTIKVDPRHSGVSLILKRPLTQRQFAEWEMGFTKLDSTDKPNIVGYSDFLNAPLNSEQFTANPSLAYEFMLAFKEGMR